MAALFSRFFLTLSTEFFISLIGIAKPIFCAPCAIAVLIPMTCPEIFRRGPPEFPGLIEASVWITPVKFSEVPPPPAVIDRESPEITPVETVFLNSPKALPIAITVWPTFIFELSPNSKVGKSFFFFDF